MAISGFGAESACVAELCSIRRQFAIVGKATVGVPALACGLPATNPVGNSTTWVYDLDDLGCVFAANRELPGTFDFSKIDDMLLPEMIAAFIALNDDEARFVSELLDKVGIRAKVISWPPQVWIYRKDLERAKPVLEQYLERGADWRMDTWCGPATSHLDIQREADEWYAANKPICAVPLLWPVGETIEVTCEECGETCRFPAVLRGRVEDCPHCGAGIDVGDDADFVVPDSDATAGEDE